MIRLSFNKMVFSNFINSSHVFLEIANEKGQFFKINQKRIKDNTVKIYGDFFELKGNDFDLQVKVYATMPGKSGKLIEKMFIKKNSYGFKHKKSHIVQNDNLKLFFDSQTIKETNSTAQQNEEDFSIYTGNTMLPSRLCVKKEMRGFSPDQRRISKCFSYHLENKACLKNVTFVRVSSWNKEKQLFFK